MLVSVRKGKRWIKRLGKTLRWCVCKCCVGLISERMRDRERRKERERIKERERTKEELE